MPKLTDCETLLYSTLEGTAKITGIPGLVESGGKYIVFHLRASSQLNCYIWFLIIFSFYR